MRIVAMTTDLMDRSRLAAALGEVEFIDDPAASAGAGIVVIDLGRSADAVTEVRAAAPEARIVAFGPHVDTDVLQHATRDGADVVIPRSHFFRNPAAAIRA